MAMATLPQFAATDNSGAHLRESTEWNESMENAALDFDLLAEYLLEDMGAGGFDFCASHEVAGAQTAPPASSVPHDPVVTPQGGSVNGPTAATATPAADLAGELSIVQQMMATQHPSQQALAGAVAAALPHQPLAPQPAPPRPPQVQSRPLPRPPPFRPPQAAPPSAPPRTLASLVAPKRAPPARTAMPAFVPRSTGGQPPPKRPRAAPKAKQAPPSTAGAPTGGYSFASAVAAVNARSVPVTAGAGPLAGAPPQETGGPLKSQAQIDRRRERNRILARRTRLRKKFFFESLQKDVADLQRENATLKALARAKLPKEASEQLLQGCTAVERLPSTAHAKEIAATGAKGVTGLPGDVRVLDREDFSLIRSIQHSQQCFVITDPSLHDNPIVYASDDFLTLTGYASAEVLGRNCRFLQGSGSCPDKVAAIRNAVAAGEDVDVTLVNYTAAGRPFWNRLFVAALRDAENNIVNFIGVIVRVPGPEQGDKEYGRVLK